MTNNSATGGYLAPEVTPAPLEGQALQRFLQQVVVGLTGLDGTLVRPRWQPEPADLPTAGTGWCSVGVVGRASDAFPYVLQIDEANAQMQRHEILDILCSFYDLGYSGQADSNAAIFRDGLSIAQNREIFNLNNFGFVEVGELMTVPTLVKERWLYRVDLHWKLRRKIERDYQVLTLTGAEGTIITDAPLRTTPFQVLAGVMALESATGLWELENSNGIWLWG